MAGEGGRRIGMFVTGFVVAIAVVFAGVAVYLKWGHPPVAVADKPFPFEKEIVKLPLGVRIAREMQTPPYAGSEEVYVSGAGTYRDSCASCHGVPGQDVDSAKGMFPSPPQLFKKHATSDVVGVSDDDPGVTFWKVKNGIRLTGMPSFQHVLSTEEMWDVTLLLKNADKPMSAAVRGTLTK